MKTSTESVALRESNERLIEIWAANLALPDVKLAPFMPARLPPAPVPPAAGRSGERLQCLIERAQGKRLGIIL